MTDVPLDLVAPHEVIWFPAHESNYGGYGGAPNVPAALVLHTPEEPADGYESTPNWFANPAANASTHYYADNDGDLYQMVADVEPAWAQGVRSHQRHWKSVPNKLPPWAPDGNNNTHALSIEIEGYAHSFEWTVAQFTSVAKWMAHKSIQYDIPLDRDHVVGHEELAVHKTDPGIARGTFNIDLLIIAAGREREHMLDALEPKADPIEQARKHLRRALELLS